MIGGTDAQLLLKIVVVATTRRCAGLKESSRDYRAVSFSAQAFTNMQLITNSWALERCALDHQRLPLLAMGYEVSCIDCSRYRDGDELGKALAYLCGLPLAMLCYSFAVSARRLHLTPCLLQQLL